MSYRQYQSVRPNETYNSIREQLERETQGLIQERSALNVQRPSANFVPSYRNLDQTTGRASQPITQHKKNQIKSKIKEIIDLCKDQNASVTKDIAGMTEAEKGIYNLLQQADMEGLPTGYAPPQGPPSTYTPIRAPEETGKNLQRDIKSIIERNTHVHLSEEALQLINEIERRALAEIEKIREQKLALINQLNDEIRRHNAQKKRSAELERQLEFYRKGQGAAGDARYENQLRARVAYLQNQLRQTQAKQGFKGDLQDFQALFAQGEAIRQETLRLLKLKEAKGYSDDAEKRRLREQIERLQRKVEQLQSQRLSRPGKPSYEVINEEYSPISQSRKQRDSYRNSANEYESLVMEMRKITSG